MSKRVIIAVTNNLQTDQRVLKVSKTLIQNGYNVILLGRKTDSAPNKIEFAKVKLFKLWFNKEALFYANYNIRLFFFLMFSKFDIVLSNDLDTLPASFLASKLRLKKIVYDSHEYFTEQPELKNQKFQKNVWLWFEKIILPKLKNTYTVSQPIADIYNKKYGADFKLVRNLPVKNNCLKEEPNKKILIYQGAIQMSRGIELMVKTMQYLPNAELWIVGKGYLQNKIQHLIKDLNLDGRVKCLGSFVPSELAKITPKASLGLSLEEDACLNYKYALPNKLFDYIQAKIPVLVSNLPEMRKIVETYRVGQVLYNREPKNVANVINKMLLATDEQKNEWNKNLKKATEILNWENESEVLLNIFNNIK